MRKATSVREGSLSMAMSKHKKLARTKTIKVTRRQVDAARSQVTADRLLGRPSDPAVEAIAAARRVAVRSADLRPSGA
jgi:hypothetical protein